MSDGIVIPLRPEPNPSDEELIKFLRERIDEYESEVNDAVNELHDTAKETRKAGEPFEFTFGKLLKYLGSLEHEEIYRLAAGGLWMIAGYDGM